jgi:hypothetical protein
MGSNSIKVFSLGFLLETMLTFFPRFLNNVYFDF